MIAANATAITEKHKTSLEKKDTSDNTANHDLKALGI
jgi:hypothetical protein